LLFSLHICFYSKLLYADIPTKNYSFISGMTEYFTRHMILTSDLYSVMALIHRSIFVIA